jgi:hypothetical protein
MELGSLLLDYAVQNYPPVCPILSQLNPPHIITSHNTPNYWKLCLSKLKDASY